MLAFAAMSSVSGCATDNPQLAVAKPVSLKIKKAGILAGKQELDENFDFPGSSTGRNLPLAGTKWELEGQLKGGHFDEIDKQSVYSLEFKPNGWFDFHADCKRGTGLYEANGQRIIFAVVKASRAHCHDHSRAEDFQTALETSRLFRQADNKLFLELKREKKSLVFWLKP